ncbi:hypothetical protein [Microbacterium sp. NPDC086615]|uniref:hypothetical protein n=1 Tax=Microbacterium sp. NPDC086615 TaxID=3154865 RepID=UPI00342BEA8B
MSEQFKDTNDHRRTDEPKRGGGLVSEQPVPHSGKLPDALREHPVNEFDNTTLPEAFEQGHLATPDSPAPLVDHHSSPKRRRGLVVGLGAGAAGLAVAAGAVFGVNALNTAPKSEPTAAAPANPSDTAPSPNGEASPDAAANPEALPITTEAYEISGELSPEQAVTTFVNDRLSPWSMAGATQETIEGHATNLSDEYTKAIAAENAKVIADALFVPGWQSNEKLRNYVAFEQRNNAGALEMWYLTSESGLPQDREPYTRSVTVEDVTVISDEGDSAVLSVDVAEHDNADKNTVDERITRTAAQVIEGKKSTGTIAIQKVENTWRVSDIEWTARS